MKLDIKVNIVIMASTLEGEVPAELMQQFEILVKAMKENKQITIENTSLSSPDRWIYLQDQIDKVSKLCTGQKEFVRNRRLKNDVLIRKLRNDQKVSCQAIKADEVLRKSSEFGRGRTIEYLQALALEQEETLIEYHSKIEKLRNLIIDLRRFMEGEEFNVSYDNLIKHIQRFDQIYVDVSQQVYRLDDEINKLKETYLEQRKQIHGRFGINPFEKQRERRQKIETFCELKGIDPFPTHNTILSLSEYIPKQTVQQQPFGSPAQSLGGTSLFGPKTGATFPFSQPSSNVSTLFGSKPQTASPFGQTVISTSAPQSTSTFSSTLSSAASGTLFKGSATTKFFGK